MKTENAVIKTSSPAIGGPADFYETDRNKPMPNIIHGTIQGNLIFLLKQHYREKYLIVSELKLATQPPSTPDICIYPTKTLDIRQTESKEREMPLTTIEILSPSQSVNEIMLKAWEQYFPLGVQSAWIVIPEFKSVRIILPDEQQLNFEQGFLTDPATGIQLEVKQVFENLR